MYTALEKANLTPNDFVVIPGAGGGLGHLYDKGNYTFSVELTDL
jgi:D-arabinose 1-dehydrogenase-like Zn-dependent alcohol dehydrogenase